MAYTREDVDRLILEVGEAQAKRRALLMEPVRMPENPSFKDVLRGGIAGPCYSFLFDERSGNPVYNKKLRAFLDRWLDNQDDSAVWEKFAAAAEKRGIPRVECFSRVAGSAAVALSVADPAGFETYTTEDWHAESAYYLDLARCAYSLAEHYLRQSKKSVGHFAAELEDRAESYGLEAKEFYWSSKRAMAEAATATHQSGGKKFSKEHLLFMKSLATSMRRDFGKPHNVAVAAITTIAYPGVVVAADDVGKAYKSGKLDRK